MAKPVLTSVIIGAKRLDQLKCPLKSDAEVKAVHALNPSGIIVYTTDPVFLARRDQDHPRTLATPACGIVPAFPACAHSWNDRRLRLPYNH
jgi:hypothetical protein